jgi:hypothetical protein
MDGIENWKKIRSFNLKIFRNNYEDLKNEVEFILTCNCNLFNKKSWNLINFVKKSYNKNMDNEQNLLMFF